MHTLLKKGRLALAVLVPAGVLLAAGLLVWRVLFPHAEAPQSLDAPDESVVPPWKLFPSGFRNDDPAVPFVGDAACAQCHPVIDQCYHAHPMGRSAAVLPEATPVETFKSEVGRPVAVGSHRLSVFDRGADRFHRLVSADSPDVPPYETKAAVAIGSGTQGRSYLTLDGQAVWQSPVSWFAATQGWDVSPGFGLSSGGRRPVAAECLSCHMDRSDPIPRTRNSFRQAVVGQAAIGCERCHGPGDLHVRERTASLRKAGRDDSIANPKHMPRERQLDICRQCHLLGEQTVARRGVAAADYRPGLPLEQFRSVFVAAPGVGTGKSVGHFEQMERSRCFTASGTMTCTTCHDPHRKAGAAEAVAHVRAACQSCHAAHGCKEREPARRAVADACARCHMPRGDSTSIAHAAVTDHSIPKRPPPRVGAGAEPDGTLVPYFKPGPFSPPGDERERDLGIALVSQSAKLPFDPPRATALDGANRRLTASTARWPRDEPALVARAEVADARKDLAAELAAARAAVRAAPHSEFAWMAAWHAERASGHAAAALAAADKLTELSPTAIDHHVRRAYALLDLKQWGDAERACRDALAIHPQFAEARVVLAAALAGANKHADSRREADRGFTLAGDAALQRQFRDWLNRRR